MSGALEPLIAEAHALLAEEREVLSTGRFAEIGRIGERKTALLGALEPAIAASPPTAELRTALERLIEESRRNERLIEAARAGLAAARRRIEGILATRRGDVAYAPDGSRISSRADSVRHTDRA